MATSTIPDEKQADSNFATAELSRASSQIVLNASGHAQEVDRTFGLFSVCALAITVDGAWIAGSGALVVALYNGGGPGVLYELLFASVFYFIIGACTSELASAIPSSASVYHWAAVTAGPKYGRICSFYAGFWNTLAWLTGISGACLIYANIVMAMYNIYHPDFKPRRWQIFIIYLFLVWGACAIVAFFQSKLHMIATTSVVLSLSGWFCSLIAIAVLPGKTGFGHASHSFVWADWSNLTGWSSDGFVFLAGTLNGAWAIGTLDAVTHVAEEMPDPRRNIPRATFIYLITAVLTAFPYYAVLLYAITDLDAVATSNLTSFPLAAIFQQAARSTPGTMGLLSTFFFGAVPSLPGAFLTPSRVLWTLGRDNALPFSSWIGRTDPKHKNPFNAAIATASIMSCFGLIFVGSAQAFNALVGSFVILTLWSYITAIGTNLITRRRHIRPGPFWMGSKTADVMMVISCAYVAVMSIIYMFPFAVPYTPATMNYACLICGGSTVLITPWYLWKRHHGYTGPIVLMDAADDVLKGHVLQGEALEKDRNYHFAEERLKATG
ncbi:Amino acid permease-like protein 21 [Elsinoe fawcettii]|nr:Amino acid permease-like protein 21 [Elsinoe fawcettii]